jgi:hypothetical protein
MLTTNSLGYLLDFSFLQSQLRGVSLLDDTKMVNNHFTSNFLPYVRVDQVWWLMLKVVCRYFVRPLGILLVIVRWIII